MKKETAIITVILIVFFSLALLESWNKKSWISDESIKELKVEEFIN